MPKKNEVVGDSKLCRNGHRYPKELKQCKECFRSQNGEAARKKRDFLNGLKSGPCADCGHCFHPAAMDFDHVRGEKLYDVGRMYTFSAEKILQEVSKCDLVCSNCHRVRTWTRKHK